MQILVGSMNWMFKIDLWCFYLKLIFQVFHFRLDCENRNLNIVPQDTIQTIFSNIKSIYKFHAEFLLPQVRYFQLFIICQG